MGSSALRASDKMRSRCQVSSECQADLLNRNIWCKTVAPSKVSGTGGESTTRPLLGRRARHVVAVAPGEYFIENAQHFLVNQAVVGEQMKPMQIERFAPHSRCL